jgi:hypothetical protein
MKLQHKRFHFEIDKNSLPLFLCPLFSSIFTSKEKSTEIVIGILFSLIELISSEGFFFGILCRIQH